MSTHSHHTAVTADAPPVEADEPSIAIVRDDIFAILGPRETLGFVERIRTVYVALSGPDLARAVEVGQSLSWDLAVAMVRRAHESRG